MEPRRLNLRRLMIAVAIVASCLGGLQAYRRYRAMVALSESYRRMAGVYSATMDKVLADANCWDNILSTKKLKIPDPYPNYTFRDAADYARDSREKARRYRSLASRYVRAARFPWLPVEPNPESLH